MAALAKVAADLQPERIKAELLPRTADFFPDHVESLNSKQTLGVALFNCTQHCLEHWGKASVGRPLAGCVCMPGTCCLCVHVRSGGYARVCLPLAAARTRKSSRSLQAFSQLPLGQQDSQICGSALCWFQQVLQKLISSSALSNVWLETGSPGSLPPFQARSALLC